MSISKKLKIKLNKLSSDEKKQLIKWTIEDKVSYSDIQKVYDLSPGDIEKNLLYSLGEKRFKSWKQRQQNRSTKKNRPISEFN